MVELPATHVNGNRTEMAAREPAAVELPGHHGEDVMAMGNSEEEGNKVQGVGGYYAPKSGSNPVVETRE